MPLYEYKCEKCSFMIDLIRPYEKRDDPVDNCEYCGNVLTRTITFPSVSLVGDGWSTSETSN